MCQAPRDLTPSACLLCTDNFREIFHNQNESSSCQTAGGYGAVRRSARCCERNLPCYGAACGVGEQLGDLFQIVSLEDVFELGRFLNGKHSPRGTVDRVHMKIGIN